MSSVMVMKDKASHFGFDVSTIDLDSIHLPSGEEDGGIPSDHEEVFQKQNLEDFDSGFGNIVVLYNTHIVPKEKSQKYEDAFRLCYSQIGVIKALWVPVDPVTENSLGHCFIQYNTPQEVELAKENSHRYISQLSYVIKRMKKNALSLYETETSSLVDQKSMYFTRSPTDPIISLFVPDTGGGNQLARVSIVQIPSKEELRHKNLFSVSDCKMYWQSNGDYLAVKVDRYTNTKQSTYTGFELFRIKERDMPIEVLELENKNDKIIAFAWEPKGHRFAVIHGDNPKPDVSIYSMRTAQNTGRVSKLTTLKGKQANALFWSPAGRFIVLAGLKGFNAQLQIFNVDELEIMTTTEHFMETNVEWEPTGRYVATALASVYLTENISNAWSFNGKHLYRILKDHFFQFLWRARPQPSLTSDKEEEIAKNLKKCSRKYEAQDVLSLFSVQEREKRGKLMQREEQLEKLESGMVMTDKASHFGFDLSTIDLDSIHLPSGEEDGGILSDHEEVFQEQNLEDFDSGFGNIVVLYNTHVVPKEKSQKYEDDVRSFYCQIGVIKALWVPVDPVTENSLGHCFIQYNTPQEVELAKAYNHRYISERPYVFFKRMKKNGLSLYETETSSLVDQKSMYFTCSPTDPIISLFVPDTGGGNQLARVSIVQIPSKEELRHKNLFSVSDCKMYWQSNGDYLAVKVDRYTNTKQSTYTGFELFRIKERDIPIEVLELENKNDKIIAFAWEPKGHRFAVIHGDNPKPDVSIYSMRTAQNTGRVSKLTTLKGKQANALFWSPAGRFIVLAGLKGFDAQLQIFDVDELEIMATTEHFMETNVEWEPTGRYVATALASVYLTENISNAWSFNGKHLYRILKDHFFQFLWRARPQPSLSSDTEKEIAKNLMKYSRKYEAEDVLSLFSVQEREKHWKLMHREEQLEKFESVMVMKDKASHFGFNLSAIDLDSIHLPSGEEDGGILSDHEEDFQEQNLEDFDSGFGNIVVLYNTHVVPKQKSQKYEDVLRRFYSPIGVIKALWVPVDPVTENSLGHCFIQYNTPQEVELAKENTHTYISQLAYMFRKMKKDALSIYETETSFLVHQKSMYFSSSPTDPIISLFVPDTGGGNQPARVSIVQITSKEELRHKNLFSVSDCKMYWQSNGDYLAVKVDRYTNTKQSTYTGFELFRIKERDIPIEVLELENKNDKIIAFAWEPKGHRFAVIHGDKPKPDVSIYSMRTAQNTGRVSKLTTLKGKQANALFWSPAGRFIVLAGLKGFNAQLQIFNVDELEIMTTTEHFITNVELQPTGRYVATALASVWLTENMANAWSFNGKHLYRILKDHFFQFLWRARPESSLTSDKEEEIAKNLK